MVRSSPKTLFNTALGFIAGCALAGCALLLLGEAPVRVRDEAEIDEPDAEAPRFAFDRPIEPEPVAPASSIAKRVSDTRPSDSTDAQQHPVASSEVEKPASDDTLRFSTSLETNGGHSNAAETDAGPTLDQQTPLASSEVMQSATDVARPSLETNGGQIIEAETAAAPTLDQPTPFASSEGEKRVADGTPGFSTSLETNGATKATPDPVALEDRVFAYLLPPPRHGRRYSPSETRGVGAQVAEWLGPALTDDRPMTIAATGDATDAQRLYQLLHDYRAATDQPVLTVDWSDGVGAFPRREGKPLIYAGGGFGAGRCLAHQGGAVVVALGSRDPSIEDLEAEARRLAIVAGRPVHVIALED